MQLLEQQRASGYLIPVRHEMSDLNLRAALILSIPCAPRVALVPACDQNLNLNPTP